MGRVLADGILFPVNKNKTHPALVLAGSVAQWTWIPVLKGA